MKLALTRFTLVERIAVREAIAAKMAAETVYAPEAMQSRFQRTRARKAMFRSLRGAIINSRSVTTPCWSVMREAESILEAREAEDLLTPDGPVSIRDDQANREVGRFATITAAVRYLDIGAYIMPTKLREGLYSINAPEGVANEVEALQAAKTLGFNVFPSMGSFYYAAKGVATTGNTSGTGWSRGFDSAEEAALAALATVPA